VIIGAKLKGPDEPPDDEEEPPPKLSVGLESLDVVDLEPTEDMDDGEKFAIASQRRRRCPTDLGLRRRL
jgi:hypothetical protein